MAALGYGSSTGAGAGRTAPASGTTWSSGTGGGRSYIKTFQEWQEKNPGYRYMITDEDGNERWDEDGWNYYLENVSGTDAQGNELTGVDALDYLDRYEQHMRQMLGMEESTGTEDGEKFADYYQPQRYEGVYVYSGEDEGLKNYVNLLNEQRLLDSNGTAQRELIENPYLWMKQTQGRLAEEKERVQELEKKYGEAERKGSYRQGAGIGGYDIAGGRREKEQKEYAGKAEEYAALLAKAQADYAKDERDYGTMTEIFGTPEEKEAADRYEAWVNDRLGSGKTWEEIYADAVRYAEDAQDWKRDAYNDLTAARHAREQAEYANMWANIFGGETAQEGGGEKSRQALSRLGTAQEVSNRAQEQLIFAERNRYRNLTDSPDYDRYAQEGEEIVKGLYGNAGPAQYSEEEIAAAEERLRQAQEAFGRTTAGRAGEKEQAAAYANLETARQELERMQTGSKGTQEREWWQKLAYAVATPFGQAAIGYSENDPYARPTEDWSEEELKLYYAITSQRGEEEAASYAREVNNSIGEKSKAEKLQPITEKTLGAETLGRKLGTDAAALAGQVAAMPGRLFSWADKMAQTIGTGETAAESGYVSLADRADARMSAVSERQNREYGTVKEDIPVIGGKGIGDLTQVLGSVLPSIVSGNLIGEAGTLLLFFGSAADSGYDEAIERGASANQAAWYSILTGAAEVAGEKISLENLLSGNISGKMWAEVLKQAGIEGSEEGFTTLLNTLSDAWIMKDRSQFNERISELTMNGTDYETAVRQAFKETADSLAWDIVGGAISGGVSSGIQQGAMRIAAAPARRAMQQADADLNALQENEQKLQQAQEILSDEELKARAEGGDTGAQERRTQAQETAAEARGKLNELDTKYQRRAADGTEQGAAMQAEVEGERKEIKSFAYDEKTRKVYAVTTDGTDFNASEARLDRGTEYLVQQAEQHPKLADDMLNLYQPGQSAERYANAFIMTAELWGANSSLTEDEAYRASRLSNSVAYDLTTKQFRKAFELGQRTRTEAAQESATPRPAARYGVWSSIEDVTIDGVTYKAAKPSQIVPPLGATLHTLSKLFKTDIRLYASEADKSGKYSGRNGFYKDGVIYIDINAHANSTAEKSAVLLTIAHELTHELRESNEVGYRELRDFVIEHMVRSGTDIEQLAREKISESGNPNMSLDDAVEEIVCNASERMLLNTKYAELMEKEKPHLFDAIRKWLSGLRDRILKIFEGEGYNKKNAYKEAKILWDVMDEMQEIWDRAMVQAQSSRLDGRQQRESGTESGTGADVKSKFKASRQEQDAEELQRKYPNLDLNEDISELDGVPAIELTDGSVIPIPVNPQRGNRYTHVEFIEKNRIDVDDLKSGGWIGNGVYDSSFQSDTQRYIDRQKARKRVAELTGNEYQQFKGSSREYNYDYLASKDDMQLTEVVPKERYSRSNIVAEGMKNAAMFGYTNNSGNAVVYIKDTDTDVIVTEKSIRHGLDRRINNQAPVIEKLGEVLSNSVKVNELIPRTENTEKTFVYVGAAKDTDNRLYIATFIVNRNTNELESYDVLYAANAKKEPAALLPTSTDNSAMFTGSVISISDLLDKVNKLFPDILSEDVLRHFGRTERPQGKIGENVLYSSRETRDTAEEAKGREESAAVLRRENRILRERIEHWKKQSRVTKEHTLRNTDTLEYARELVKRLDSAATSAEVNQGLQEMGAYLLNAENVDWDMLWEHALTLAHSMTDDVDIVISDEMKAEREDFESFLKSVPVDVAPLVKAGEISYSDLKGYPIVHRKNGTTVDDLYQQLQERFGEEIFPDVPDGGDMIDNIKRYADAVQEIRGNPYADYLDETATLTALEIIDKLTNGELRQSLPTPMDRAEKKLNDQKEKAREQIAKIRRDKNARIAQIKAEGSARTQQRVAAERAKRTAAIKEVSAKYQEMIQQANSRRRENADRKKYREQVERIAGKLGTMLESNSDKKHIPEALKGTVENVLKSIDLTSTTYLKTGEQTQKDAGFFASMSKLNDILSDQNKALRGEEGSDGLDMYLDISDEVKRIMREFVNKAREADIAGASYTVNDMDAEELRNLSMILTNLDHAVRDMNELFVKSKYENVTALAGAVIRYLDNLGKGRTRSKAGKTVHQFLAWENLTPYYAFKRLGEGGETLFKGLRQGWDKLAYNAGDIIEFTNGLYTAKEARQWQKHINSFTLEDGTKIQMTDAQIMAYHCLSKREQARLHIDGGGIRIADIDTKAGQVKQTDHVRLSLKDMAMLERVLTDRQVEVADAMQKFMVEVCGEWGNEISMARYGYRAFTERNYFPIEVDDNDGKLVDPEVKSSDMWRLLNLSATKSTVPNAERALVIHDIFEVFTAHSADMAKYNALALPLLDLLKVVNYKDRIELDEKGAIKTKTTQKSLERAYGNIAKKYMTTFIKDMNGVHEGGTTTADRLTKRIISRYKAASVGANIRVAIQQPTAYVRAAMVLNPKYLAQGLKPVKGSTEEMLKHSGIAAWKDLGFVSTDIGRGMRDQIMHTETLADELTEKSMTLAEWGDKITWSALWRAAKAEVSDTTGLTGEELLKKTAERFEEIVYSTQVVDATMTRSHNMRNPGILAAMSTAYMAEPTLSYNIVLDAFSEWQRLKREGQNVKPAAEKMVRAIASYAASGAATLLAASLWDAFRDDDEYESFWQKYTSALFGDRQTKWYQSNVMQELLIWNKIPVLKDIWAVAMGDSVERMDMQPIQNMWKAIQIDWEAMQIMLGRVTPEEGEYSQMTGYGKVMANLRGFAQISGLPLYNMTRDVIAIYNTALSGFTGQKLRSYVPDSRRDIRDAYLSGFMTEEDAMKELVRTERADDENDAYWILQSWNEGNDVKSETMTAVLDAVKAGDRDAYTAAVKELTEHGVHATDIRNEITDAVQKWYQGTAQEKKSISKEQAVQLLTDYAKKNIDSARKAVEKWTCRLVTGIDFSSIRTEYIDGNISESRAVELYSTYGYGDRSKQTQSQIDEGRASAEELVRKWKCTKETGMNYDSLQDYYAEGVLSYEDVKEWYIRYGGKTEENAVRYANKTKFIGADSYPGITVKNTDVYYEYVDGMDKKLFADAVEEVSKMKGEDKDGDGKSDAYSAMDKKFAYINGLPLSAEEKTRLAEALIGTDGKLSAAAYKRLPWK